jgi:hypothetical protein
VGRYIGELFQIGVGPLSFIRNLFFRPLGAPDLTDICKYGRETYFSCSIIDDVALEPGVTLFVTLAFNQEIIPLHHAMKCEPSEMEIEAFMTFGGDEG